MIFVILIGATLFSLVFRGLGGDDMVHRALGHLPGGAAGAILVVMLAMFLLGFVMDAFEIIFVVVPIVAPPLLKLHGVDPVWLGIMMAMNLQTSYMHPPLGPTLFFLRGVAPPEITTRHIYRRHHPVRGDPALRPGRAVVRAGACDRAAACALWRKMRDAHEGRRNLRSQGPRGAGDRRVGRPGPALRRGAGGERRVGRAGGAPGRQARTRPRPRSRRPAARPSPSRPTCSTARR